MKLHLSTLKKKLQKYFNQAFFVLNEGRLWKNFSQNLQALLPPNGKNK